MTAVTVDAADPQGAEALSLLRLAAIEARALYPGRHGADDAWPTNGPTPPRGAYFVAHADGAAVGMGAHRPLDQATTEVRRMFVHPDRRRQGVARALLEAVTSHATRQGFTCLRLETGHRQMPAMRLYESCGFARIPPFGPYLDDPTSVCFEKPLRHA